jgi:small subunit ribosomal protein S16
MVKIRLKRQGRKKRPFYRIVVTDIRNRRDGAPIEELGFYNPLSKELKLNKASATEWLAKGAQASDTAKRLIEKAPESGELIVLEVAKKARLSKKAKAKAEEEKAKAAEAAEQAKAEKEAEAAAATSDDSDASEEASADDAPAEAE